jgi:hypothetical protein
MRVLQIGGEPDLPQEPLSHRDGRASSGENLERDRAVMLQVRGRGRGPWPCLRAELVRSDRVAGRARWRPASAEGRQGRHGPRPYAKEYRKCAFASAPWDSLALGKWGRVCGRRTNLILKAAHEIASSAALQALVRLQTDHVKCRDHLLKSAQRVS